MEKMLFTFDRDELKDMIDRLSFGLALRPEPEGLPFYDLESAMKQADDYFETLRCVAQCHDRLCGDDLHHLVKAMVTAYHRLWSSPMPAGQEAGQVLFSAILERPMRNLLRGLVALRDNTFDGQEPFLSLDAEVEVRCFTQWRESQQPAKPFRSSSRPAKSSCLQSREPNFGYGSLAVSFLLGWWFGDDS